MEIKRVAVTGNKGLLGSYIQDKLGRRVFGLDLPYNDFTDYGLIRVWKDSWDSVSLIIHCGAYTNVDAAEDNPDLAYKVNAFGTENIALLAQKLDVPMVYISTEAVFGGSEGSYNTWAWPFPISTYGKSKAAGEDVVKSLLKKFYIVRTNTIYGSGRSNFVTQAIDKFKTEDEPTFHTIPQKIQLTYVEDLAAFILKLVDTERYGVYHYTNSGSTSRHEILDYLGLKFNKPYKEELFHLKAYRGNCILDLSLTEELFGKLPTWQESLEKYSGPINLDEKR